MPAFLPRRRGARGDLVQRYKYVFVVAYGRSGSTLLMGLLNTIPGYRIVGENLNALYRLYQADSALRLAHGRQGRDSYLPYHAWYGATEWQLDAFRCGLVETFVSDVLCPRRGTRVLGFKEVRYTENDMPDLPDFLNFVEQSFPSSKVILNHRNPADVATSAWWADVPGSLELVRSADARLLHIPSDTRHYHFCFDEIDESLDNIRAMFRWLGEEMDEKKVRATLARRHSYASRKPNLQVPQEGRRGVSGRARALAKRILGVAQGLSRGRALH
jgi:Sulfotransferase family